MENPRNTARYLTGLIVTLVALTGAALGQTSNTWTAIGPGASRYVNAFAIDPANPNVIYVGTYDGVFKTTDGGASWTHSHLPPTRAIAVDPVNPNNVYAGTHPGGSCSGQSPLFRSADAGATWSNASSPTDCDVSVIVLDPLAPTTIYAQATALWSINGDPVGFWKSTDGGISWGRQGALGPGLWINPSNPKIIYAPNGDYYDTSSVNLFKSTDGGASWYATGLASDNLDDHVSALALDPINPNVLYAVTYDYGETSKLLKSIDGGTSWLALGSGLPESPITTIVVARDNPRTLYIATYRDGVFKSLDGGAHWSALNDGLTNQVVLSLVLAPGNPRVLFAGTNGGGVFKFVDTAPSVCANSIDCAESFARQHYLDFLNRDPDANGLAFWTNEIALCGGDPSCEEVKRINVSAAFFLSIEFQHTGYLVYRVYKSSYGDLPGTPVPVRLNEFLPDTQQIGQGVVVNQAGWEQLLENNKQTFVADFVARSRFTSVFPNSMTPAEFVDTLFANSGITPAESDRLAAVNEFGSATTTSDTAARARALRRVAENSTLAQQEFNRAFVLMQYFGYLRRNPNDPPELTRDFQGYNFWLTKLTQFNGDFAGAEMVKAFITSGEYRQRFEP